MNKRFFELLSVLIAVSSIAACGGGAGDFRDPSLRSLEKSNCFANGGSVTCDVRECAADCKVYVEQDGNFIGVVGLCPDKADGHTVTFTNDFQGSIDILCRRGRGDEPRVLAEGLGDVPGNSFDPVSPVPMKGYTNDCGSAGFGASGLSSASAACSSTGTAGVGQMAGGGTGGIATPLASSLPPTHENLQGTWRATRIVVTDLGGKKSDLYAEGKRSLLMISPDSKISFNVSDGAEQPIGPESLVPFTLSGDQIQMGGTIVFGVSLTAEALTFTHIDGLFEGTTDITWEKI